MEWQITIDGKVYDGIIGDRNYDSNNIISDNEPVADSLNKIVNYLNTEDFVEKRYYPAWQDFTAVGTEYYLTLDQNATSNFTIDNLNRVSTDILDFSVINPTNRNLMYKSGSLLNINSNVVRVLSFDSMTGKVTLNFTPKNTFRINYLCQYANNEVPIGKKLEVENTEITVKNSDDASEIAYNNSTSALTSTDVQSAIDELARSGVATGSIPNLGSLANINLDNYKTSCAFYATTGCTNLPTGETANVLIKVMGDGNVGSQEGIGIASGLKYTRTFNGSTFSNWSKNLTEIDDNIMGVRFVDNGSSFTATRYGASIGKTYTLATAGTVNTINSDFDTMPVYRLIRRCIVNKEDVIVAFQGEANYDDTLTLYGYAPHTHRVMVYIPKFYKRVNVLYEPNHVVDIAISERPFTEATVDPIFRQVDLDGSLVERPYILISAFEGVAVNKDTGAYLFTDRTDVTTRINADFKLGTPSGLTTYANYLLTSVNKQNAQAPATNATLSNFRLMSQNWNLGKTSKKATTQFQYYAQVMLNHLFMIEFTSTNWQTILSAGVTNLKAGSFNDSVSTGYTSILGNKSGYITGIVRGALGTTQVSSYRGIENPFGNVWKFCEGFRKLSTGLGNEAKYGIYDITKTNDYSNFIANDFIEQEHLLNLPTISQYFRYRNDKLISNRTETGTNYYNDYIYSNATGQFALVGGSWTNGYFAGGFILYLNSAFGAIYNNVGARFLSC